MSERKSSIHCLLLRSDACDIPPVVANVHAHFNIIIVHTEEGINKVIFLFSYFLRAISTPDLLSLIKCVCEAPIRSNYCLSLPVVQAL